MSGRHRFVGTAEISAVTAPQADTRPQPGVVSTIAAGARVAFDEIEDVQAERLDEAYRPIVDALAERGVERGALKRWQRFLPTLPVIDNGVYDRDAVWREIARARQADPQAFAELGTREQFERGAVTRGGDRGRDLDVLRRGSGIAGFAGGMAGTMADPVNLATLPVGGFGKTLATRVLTEGLVQGAIQAAQIPQVGRARAAMGEDYTAEEMLLDVVLAAGGGASIRGGIEGAPKIDAGLYKALAPLRERFPGGKVTERDLARAFFEMVPEHLRTVEQEAALATLPREGAIDASNPFPRTYEGLDAHRARLTEAIEAIEDGRIPVDRPIASLLEDRGSRAPRAQGAEGDGGSRSGKLHGGIVGFFVRNGLSEAQARGIAAGIHAESGSNPAALNPTSGAFGLGQWLGPRKRAIVERYGPNPTMEQQLEFLLWELRGGDHGGRAVLAQGDEASVLRSYIEDFMRPAKGAETTGDLRRGMDALGRGSEDLPLAGSGAPGSEAGAGGGGDAGLAAALAAEEADLAGRRASLGAEGVERPDIGAADAVDAPAVDLPPDLDPPTLTAGLADALRPIALEDGGRSFNRTAELAGELGVSEDALRGALDSLVAQGALRKTRSGLYRRLATQKGEDDLVRFVARQGGLSYDGFGAAQRARNAVIDNPPRGHDLKNTGHLDRFVPQVGPLLRPTGKGLDEMAELAWEAGYFGPAETTPRPTERELLDLLGELTRTGEKRYPGGGSEKAQAASEPDPLLSSRRRDLFWGEEHYAESRARYDAAAMRVLGRKLEEDEFLDAFEFADPLPQGRVETGEEAWANGAGLDPDIHAMVNRRFEEALDDLYIEAEDDFYDLQAWEIDNAARGEDPAGGDRGEGSARVAGDAGEGGGGGEAGPRAAGPAELDRLEAEGLRGPDIPESKAEAARFDSDAGDGMRAIAESDWHDIRAQLIDPAIAERQRAEAKLAAEAPLQGAARTGKDQDGTMGLGLFDAADQPKFDLEEIGIGRGKGPLTAAEIEAELAAEKAGLEAIRQCLK